MEPASEVGVLSPDNVGITMGLLLRAERAVLALKTHLLQTAALFEVASHHVEETCDQQLVSIASTALSVMRNLPRNTLPLLSTAHPQTSSLVLQPTSQASPTLVVPSMLPTSSVHEHAVTVQPTVSTLVVPSSHALLNVPLMDDVTTAIRCSEPWPEQSKTLPPLTPYTITEMSREGIPFELHCMDMSVSVASEISEPVVPPTAPQYLLSITAMGAFEGFSFEELRWAYRQRWTSCDYACSNSVVASHASAMCLHAAVDRWAVTRSEAAAAAKPHGYCLETSFTSAQPMHGWTVQHAIRELWQNMRDGAAAAFGPGALSPTFSSDRFILARLLRDIGHEFDDDEEEQEEEEEEEDGCDHVIEGCSGENLLEGCIASRHAEDTEALLGRVEFRVKGVLVGSVDASVADVVVFTQRFAALKPLDLLLASSKGVDAAGAHGEGFKVAINLLLARGFGVTYTMDGQRWRFVHESLHSAEVRTMVVQMSRTLVSSADLVIEVTGPGAAALFRVEQDWDIVHAALLEISQRPPAALSVSAPPFSAPLLLLRSGAASLCVHPLLAGRVYCRNIFVNVDSDLRILGLTVNLDCHLQRDRHELPRDMPKRIGRIVQALAGQYYSATSVADACLPVVAASPFAGLCSHLLAAFRAHPAELHAYAPKLRDSLRTYAAELAGCKPHDVVFLRASERPGEGLAGLGLLLLPHSGELSDRSNEHDILLACAARLTDWVPLAGSRQAVRREWFKALLLAIAGLGGFGRFRLRVVSASDSAPFVCLAHADPSRLVCYISSQLIVKPQGWRQMAQLLSTELVCYVLPQSCCAPLSQLVAAFMENPIAFTRAGWHIVNHGAGHVESTPLSMQSRDQSTLLSTQTHCGESEEIDIRVRVPRCGGARLAFLGAPPPDGDFIEPPPPCACIPPLCRLVTRSVCVPGAGGSDQRILYVDAAVLKEAETAGGPLETVVQSMPVLLRRFDVIVQRVETALQCQQLPVFFVVCAGLLGFNSGGGLYINLWPLARSPRAGSSNTPEAVDADFLQVLLHEVAHFRTMAHDASFARHLAALVWACRDCCEIGGIRYASESTEESIQCMSASVSPIAALVPTATNDSVPTSDRSLLHIISSSTPDAAPLVAAALVSTPAASVDPVTWVAIATKAPLRPAFESPILASKPDLTTGDGSGSFEANTDHAPHFVDIFNGNAFRHISQAATPLPLSPTLSMTCSDGTQRNSGYANSRVFGNMSADVAGNAALKQLITPSVPQLSSYRIPKNVEVPNTDTESTPPLPDQQTLAEYLQSQVCDFPAPLSLLNSSLKTINGVGKYIAKYASEDAVWRFWDAPGIAGEGKRDSDISNM